MAGLRWVLASMAVGLSLATSAAASTVIVDTGKPLHGVNYVLNATQSLAVEFNVTTAMTLTDLAGWMYGVNAPGTFTVELRAGGNRPGAILFSDTATANLPFALYGVHGESWLIGPGSYWLAFEVRPGQTLDGYMPTNPPSPLGPEAYSTFGTYVRLDSLNVGVRISGDLVTGLPEAQTWALMIVGFGGLGAMLRRRKAHAASLVRRIHGI